MEDCRPPSWSSPGTRILGRPARRIGRRSRGWAGPSSSSWVSPPDGGRALAAAVRRVSTYGWVAFTSANGVERFCSLLHDARDFGSAKVAAIGPGTAGALARRGVVADLVPDQFVAESVVDAFPA